MPYVGVIEDRNGPVLDSVQEMCEGLKGEAVQAGICFDIGSF